MLIASVLKSSALETSRRELCRDKSSGIGTLLVVVQSTLATPPQERGIDSRTCTVTCTVTDPGVSIYTPSYTVHSAVAKKKKARQKTCQKKKSDKPESINWCVSRVLRANTSASHSLSQAWDMIQIPCTSRTRETTSWGVLRNCTRTSFFRRAISGFTWLTNGSHWCWTYILSHYYGWANDTPEYMICGSHWCWTHILSHYYGWANDIWYVDPIGVAHIYYPTSTGGKMIHDMWIPLVLHIYIIPLLRVDKW